MAFIYGRNGAYVSALLHRFSCIERIFQVSRNGFYRSISIRFQFFLYFFSITSRSLQGGSLYSLFELYYQFLYPLRLLHCC